MTELSQDNDAQAATVKAVWQTPQVVRYGRVATLTLQISGATIGGGGGAGDCPIGSTDPDCLPE